QRIAGMNKTTWALVVIAALAVFGALFFYRYRLYVQQQEPVAAVATPAAAPPVETPPLPPPPAHYPVPESEPQTPPLPALDSSDSFLLSALEQVLGNAAVEKYLIPKQLIHNWVATIDSLDREPVPARVRPWRAVAGQPLVHTDGGSLTLSADNAQRYRPYIAALTAVDAGKLAGLYLHAYPLFQQAYRQLGYPKGYFNDRLIAIIDHLLAAPEVTGPIQLVQPKVFYEFADPSLEQLSWGQKLMIRIGSENEAAVKAKLREIRAAIVARAPAEAPAETTATP
ncbi:MAG: DUF3014 domain-containing protein, partial [Stenotrophobium sp.]